MSKRKQTSTLTHVTGEMQQLIGFTIGKHLFGTDLASVHEILRTTSLTKMPNAPDYVEGLMKLRGRVFPLVNLGKKMGLGIGRAEKNSRIIVLEIQAMLTGIIVDTVTGVFEIHPDNVMDSTDASNNEIDPLYYSAVYQEGGREILLPDFDRIFLMND